jgi:hypothetical membrane protein
VIPFLATGIGVAALLLAGWTGVQASRRRPTTEGQMIGAIVVEVGLLVQALIAVFRVAGTDLREPVTFLAYLFGVLLVLPLGFYLAREERSRWGSLSLCFTAVVVAVMVLRLVQLWGARG